MKNTLRRIFLLGGGGGGLETPPASLPGVKSFCEGSPRLLSPVEKSQGEMEGLEA